VTSSPQGRAGPAEPQAEDPARLSIACAEIERCITRLVREAPAVDEAVAGELIERLRAIRGIASPLALSIARIVELVAEQLVAPGAALPHLAMSCATLAGGVAGRLSARELEAARYEVDTLLPVPDLPPDRQPYHVRVPDVPLAALIRGPRRRT
jgi:hypothetical protein